MLRWLSSNTACTPFLQANNEVKNEPIWFHHSKLAAARPMFEVQMLEFANRYILQVKFVALRAADPEYPDIPIVNLTTLENRQLCVAITTCGLCIIGDSHDSLAGLSHVTSNDSSDQPDPSRSHGHVKLSQQVSIASAVYDEVNIKYYETIYSLLDDISPMYRGAFCSELSDKLLLLQQSQGNN